MEKLPELLTRTGHKNLESLMLDYGFDINTKEGKFKLLQELAARWAETLVNKPQPTWWKELLAAIGDWIKRFAGHNLNEYFGEEFTAKYIAYENNDNITKNRIKAKDLWKKILTSYFESGSPFLCFKDSANKANPNQHAGHIRSSNLCTEIFQNTNPNHYKIKIEFEDGTIKTFEEEDLVIVDGGITKKQIR